MFKARIWPVLIALLLAATAQAATLVVYPFAADDPITGTAVSRAVADAFRADHEVYGPAVAPTAAPPFHHEGGFYNPVTFHDDTSGLSATMLLRGATGADLVLNGHISEVDGLLVLQLAAALEGRQLTLSLEAPADDPAALATQVTTLAAGLLRLPAVPAGPGIDLGGTDGLLAEAVYNAGLTGGLEQALAQLEQPELEDEDSARTLARAIRAVLEGTDDGDPVLRALLSLNAERLDEARSADWFRTAAAQAELPALQLWEAMLRLSSGSSSGEVTLPEAAPGWPYGQAVRLVHSGAPAEKLAEELAGADSAALTAYSIAARINGDTGLEKDALRRLTKVDPWQAGAFERLSFIAFDEDDPLTALEALAVAVQLEPGNDLYWTNLGWAQYLNGLPEQSEQSSERAVLLAPGQTVAHYNLGLVRITAGRLGEALEAYTEALRHDPAVNDAALEDLEDALGRFPGEPAVHYGLAWLLEARGERSLAREHYGSYLERRPAGTYAERARARIEMLELPPPELQVQDSPTLQLGRTALDPSAVQAGDPLTPVFEVWTPGEVLPPSLSLELELTSDATGEEAAAESTEVTLPPDTVGFVIDAFILPLPADLEPGAYTLQVTVSASEGREVRTELGITVSPAEDPLRKLFGYGITLQAVDSGAPLFDSSDLGDWEGSSAVLLEELARMSDAADDVLPRISQGRFEGLTGGEAFRAVESSDLRDFLRWIAHRELQGASFVFVDTFAQWILDGTPGNQAD